MLTGMIGLKLVRASVLLFLVCHNLCAGDFDDTQEPDFGGANEGVSSEGVGNDLPEDNMDLFSRLGALRGDGMGTMFRDLGRMFPNISQGTFRQTVNLPSMINDNPCFDSEEKMRDLFGDISNALTGFGTDNRQADKFFNADDVSDDADDLFEKLSDSSAQCITGSMNNNTKVAMCRKFARRRGSSGFGKLMTSGVDCVSVLMSSRQSSNDDDDDDDDDEDDLSLPQQKIVMRQLRKRPFNTWSTADLNIAWQLAPDDMDDDFVEGLTDDVFESSIGKLGQIIARNRGTSTFRAAVRNRLTVMRPPKQLRASDITNIGRGFAAYDVDDIDEISGDELFGAILDGLDIESDDPRHLAIGRVMQHGRDFSTFQPDDVKRLIPFQRGNPRFASQLNPNVLASALTLLSSDDIGDEAGALCRTLRKSSEFDDEDVLDGIGLQKMGRVLTGCGQAFVNRLTASAVKTAINTINDFQFDDSDAKSLLDKLDLGEAKHFTKDKIMMAGKLAKAFSLDDFEEMPDDLMDAIFVDLDDVDLEDWNRLAMVTKAIRANANRVPTQIFHYPQFANALGIDDVSDIDDVDLKERIKTAIALRVRHSLASIILRKLRSINQTGGALKSNDLYAAGNMVIGLSRDDFLQYPDDKSEVLRMSAILSDHMDDLSDSQVEGVVEKIKKVYNFDNSDHVDVNEDEVLQTAPFLKHLSEEDFEKLRFSRAGKAAFLQAISRDSTRKNSRPHLQYLFKKSVEMVHELHDDQGKGPDDLTEFQVRQLRGVLPGIQEHTIRKLPREAILRNLDVFEDVDLGDAQGKALVERVTEEDPSWNCRRERLAQIAPYIHNLSEDQLKTICKPELAAASSQITRGMEKQDRWRNEREREGFSREDENTREDDDGKVTVIKHIINSVKDDVTTRRRRATRGLTCDAIKLMGTKAILLDRAELEAIDAAVEFPNCLEYLGSLDGWSKEKQTFLLNKAKQTLGQVSTWTAADLRRAGSIMGALPAEAFKTLQLTSVGAMARIGRHWLGAHQLRGGVYRWLALTKNNDVTNITGPELASLKHFICGLDDKDIAQLPQKSFKEAIHEIGKVRNCDLGKLRALAGKTISTYSEPISQWPGARISDIGSIIGGFYPAQISQLTANHIAEISPDVIRYLPKETVKSFNTPQLKTFSTNQANAVTLDQYQNLQSAQQNVLRKKATLAFKYHIPGAATSLQQLSLVSLMLSMWFCFVLTL